MIKYDDISEHAADGLLERFLRYVRIFTTSDDNLAEHRTPSTDNQWDLIRLLEKELGDIGVDDVSVDTHGYLIGRIPGNRQVDTIGFLAHVDTNADAPGENVTPVIHNSYDGEPIQLKGKAVLDPDEFPLLKKYLGETIITTDGSTLLGADDKAGIAEIITAVWWLMQHPEIPRGDVEIIFTPDEETGWGMKRFPLKSLKSACCFTLDGGEEGELEIECFYARKAEISFNGRLLHPGQARGKMINAVTMASQYISMLPRNESPEATDGRYGNYWPHSIEGGLEQAHLSVMFRSFDRDDMDRRSAALHSFAKAIEAAFPGGSVDVRISDLYNNMKEEIARHPRILDSLREAYRLSDVRAIERPIRGGTDGSHLSSQGIPTPNIFAGGQNFHSRTEWIALPAMLKAVTVILNLIECWAVR